MDANQTLYDFVVNLITNSDARAEFQLDPQGALNQAGLGDVTAADVQDVVPLVVDYAGYSGSVPAAGDVDLGALDNDPAGVVGELQAITQQLAVADQPPSLDGSIAAVGTLAADPASVGVAASTGWGAGVTASPAGVHGDLSGGHDLAATLDSGVVPPVGADLAGAADATGAVGVTGDTATGTVDGLIGGDGTLGTAGAVGDQLTAQLDNPTDLVDPLGGADLPPSVPDLGTAGGSAPVDGATGALDETLDDTLDDLDGVGGPLDGGVGAGVEGDSAAEAGGQGSADSGLLDDTTDILF